jgi:threonine/homoserine/homoserine lactone efflux protein
MDIIFWKGIFIGILIALPTGPVGFLTIRRFFVFGMRSGMYSAIGAICSDAFYGIVEGFGLQTIKNFLVSISGYAEIIAGIALVWIAWKSIKKPLNLEHIGEENHPVQDITSTAILNILNPTLIFSFTTLFVLMGINKFVGHTDSIIIFLVGIAIGTSLFWFLIGRGIIYLRNHDRSHHVQEINRITALILGAVGIILLLLSIIKIIF